MIKTFSCKKTEKLFHRFRSHKLPQNIEKIALRKLTILHAATSINDLRIPLSNHLELLKGKRKGIHSIRINDQWRICFKWKQCDAYDVEIIDYH